MYVQYVFFAALLIGTAWGQSPETTTSTILDYIPEDQQKHIDVKTVESIQNKSLSEFKIKCEKNGGPDAFAKAENASKELYECVTSIIDMSTLQGEIESAKPNGTVDEVFKKYCDKKPLIEKCALKFTEASRNCFAPDEQKHLKTVYNLTEKLVEFICFKEGDRIALFIAEGGQECFQEKQEGLKGCFNKTFGAEPELKTENLSNMTISFDKEQCSQMTELQECVVAELGSCPKPTSANIVESLFNFIRKATPCNKFSETAKKPNSASTYFVASATILMSMFATLLL